MKASRSARNPLHRHRYFFARATYRSSLRWAARNLPRHRRENGSRSSEARALSADSIKRDSDIPSDRARLLASGSSSSSMVTVSLVLMATPCTYLGYEHTESGSRGQVGDLARRAHERPERRVRLTHAVRWLSDVSPISTACRQWNSVSL